MLAILGTIVTAVAALFGQKGGGSLVTIPDKFELDIDLWEKNQILFVLIFLMVMAFLATRI